MVKFSKLFMNFMLIGIVVLSLFSYIVLTQEENNIEDKFVEDSLMNKTFENLKTNLEGIGEESQAQKTLFESENPTSGFGTILLFSIVSAGKIFNGMIIGVYNVLISLPASVLGLDPIILSILGTMLIFTIILGLWIVFKLGG